jgi:hypothetical protein
VPTVLITRPLAVSSGMKPRTRSLPSSKVAEPIPFVVMSRYPLDTLGKPPCLKAKVTFEQPWAERAALAGFLQPDCRS